MARSGRKMRPGTASAARTDAPAMRPARNFRETTPVSPRPADGALFWSASLARLLDLANGRQRHHGDARRRHVVVGHEEIRHQRHAGIDAVWLEISDAALVKQLVVDAELSGELA